LIVRFVRFWCLEHAAQAERAAPGGIGIADRLFAVDDLTTRREVRPLEYLHQAFVLDMWVVDQLERRVDHFGDIVRRDVRRHADGDPTRAISEQVWKQPRHQLWFLLFAVVGRDEVDGPGIEPFHQLHRGLGQTRFGIAIRSGIIAINIAEIALPFDQGISQRKILREPHHCVIGRGVAVGMVFADHFSHDPRRFFEGVRWIKLELTHRP